MRKRFLLGGLGGAIGAGVAYQLLRRERETVWEQFKDEVSFADKSRFIEIDGLRIHYQEFGEQTAPTLVLIHGYSSSTATFHSVAPLLAENGFRVLVVDLVGFGFSDKPFSFDYTIDSQARVILRLMNVLSIGRATLVGSSYGGAVALSVALDNAERIDKLILIGAVSNNEIRNSAIVKLSTLPVLGEVVTPLLANSRTYVKTRLHNSYNAASHHLIDDAKINSVMLPLKSRQSHKALLVSLKNWNAARIERNLNRIKTPTLLVWGENDKIIPLRNGKLLRKHLPNAKLIVYKDCGHVPHEEYTTDFVQLAVDFLQDE